MEYWEKDRGEAQAALDRLASDPDFLRKMERERQLCQEADELEASCLELARMRQRLPMLPPQELLLEARKIAALHLHLLEELPSMNRIMGLVDPARREITESLMYPENPG